jgi:hypothetical protein
VWRKACVRAGFDGAPLDGLVFHELRRTAVALAVDQGAHPLAIKERMGHASIQTMMDTYGGLFPSIGEEIAQGLDLPRALAVGGLVVDGAKAVPPREDLDECLHHDFFRNGGIGDEHIGEPVPRLVLAVE